MCWTGVRGVTVSRQQHACFLCRARCLHRLSPRVSPLRCSVAVISAPGPRAGQALQLHLDTGFLKPGPSNNLSANNHSSARFHSPCSSNNQPLGKQPYVSASLSLCLFQATTSRQIPTLVSLAFTLLVQSNNLSVNTHTYQPRFHSPCPPTSELRWRLHIKSASCLPAQ